METIYYLGIDISKLKFDAALTVNGKAFDQLDCENDSKSIEPFFKALAKKYGLSYTQLVVCLEHTGFYCQPLLDFLVKNNIKVCVNQLFRSKDPREWFGGKTIRWMLSESPHMPIRTGKI